MLTTEPATAVAFRNWLTDHGGEFHPHARFAAVPSGFSVVGGKDLPGDTTIVKCPFDLAITEELAQRCLLELVDLRELIAAKQWSERQWISSYLCFHWILEDSSHLLHHAYLKTLPCAAKLRTPLHFNKLELQRFQGTNLYGATLDRERECRNEWSQCQAVFAKANPEWGNKFSWEAYLTAATFLSSRAFPSSLLSPSPSLQSSPDTKPVLLPGVDALNHARGQPVSWVVSYPKSDDTGSETPTISLVLHNPSKQGQELFNNYGPKPNSELILGYGFSLPRNPDDTIVLKIGGINGKKWEVGRCAQGADGLWEELLHSVQQDPDTPPNYEDHLDAAAAFLDMLQSSLDRLPSDHDDRLMEMRPEVAQMLHDYVQGQRDILHSLVDFAREKEQLAVDTARAEGIDIVLED